MTHWLGTQMPTSTAPGGGVTITPQLGISYYFDSVGNNCASGELKISVYVYHGTNLQTKCKPHQTHLIVPGICVLTVSTPS